MTLTEQPQDLLYSPAEVPALAGLFLKHIPKEDFDGFLVRISAGITNLDTGPAPGRSGAYSFSPRIPKPALSAQYQGPVESLIE